MARTYAQQAIDPKAGLTLAELTEFAENAQRLLGSDAKLTGRLSGWSSRIKEIIATEPEPDQREGATLADESEEIGRSGGLV